MSAPCTQGLDTLAATIVAWQHQHGRHGLPWQNTTDPYRIWLSEIMLQQTQVATVIDYYLRFLQRFPDVATLAHASQDEVMPYWAGLGYYARARNLHACAQTILEQHQGQFPACAAELVKLPGIGRSTAAAIAAFAYGERSPIMDGNVKRVFTRHFGVFGDPNRRATENILWDMAAQAINQAPANLNMGAYTQGLMDLGATLCTRSNSPACNRCPLQSSCYAFRHAQQHALPQPRTRKAIPQRHCVMLILEHQGKILLEQRPSPGIWGGLWSLPQFDDASQLETALVNWGIPASISRDLPVLSHAFSHFRLHIQPQHRLVKTSTAILSEPDSDHAWTAPEQLNSIALPAPIRTLLTHWRPGQAEQSMFR